MKPGHEHLTVRIDETGVGGGEFADVGGGSDGEDACRSRTATASAHGAARLAGPDARIDHRERGVLGGDRGAGEHKNDQRAHPRTMVHRRGGNDTIRFVRNAILLLFPMVLGAAQLTIDHVTVAGSNLRTMRLALASVGIQVEYGGLHQNHATEMALTSFADGSYLELIAIQGDAEPDAVKAHTWSAQMLRDAGAGIARGLSGHPTSMPRSSACGPPGLR